MVNIIDFETFFESRERNYYHGTTKTRAENIYKNGFYTQYNVNVIDDYDEALEYASELADEEEDEPYVIKVKLKPRAKPMAERGLDACAYKAKDVIIIPEDK